MTSHVHDTPLKLCRARPEFATKLVTELLDFKLPAYDEVLPYSESATDIEVRDLNCDGIAVCRKEGTNQLGIIVEVQREESDKKLWSWPAYLANIRHRISAPIALVVVCAKQSVAVWARKPIGLGPGSVVQPLVIGPEDVPKLVVPSGNGSKAEVFVLSALMHHSSSEGHKILRAAREEYSEIPPELGAHYARYTLSVIEGEARNFMETLMKQNTYPYENEIFADLKAEFRAEGLAEGKAEGLAEGIAEGSIEAGRKHLRLVLVTRGIEVTAEDDQRIADCENAEQFDTWIKRALTAADHRDVFSEAK